MGGGAFPKNLVLRETIIVCATVIGILLLPFLLLIAVSLIAFRACLTCYKNRLKVGYGDLLSGMNSVFGAYDPYTDKDGTFNVTNYFLLDGHPSLETIRDLIENTHRRFEKEGMYPELKQELTSLMGFAIWKDLEHYSPRDYVHMLDAELLEEDAFVTDENIAALCHRLTKRRFPKNTPVWEYILCHDVRMKGREDLATSLLVFRCHHSLGDGLSFIRYFGQMLNGPPNFVSDFIDNLGKRNGNSSKRNILWSVWFVLSFPVMGFYDIVKRLVTGWDSNAWHGSYSSRSSEFHYKLVLKMPKEDMTGIRNVRGGVKFFSVLLGALTGGIRKYFVEHNLPVPDSMCCFVPTPIPQREVKLSNNIISFAYDLPIGMNHRQDILQFLDKQAQAISHSREPLGILLIAKFMGLTPRIVTFPWMFCTLASSNLPGFDQPVEFNGHQLLNVSSIPAISGANNSSIHCWCIGYNGTIHLTLGVSKDVVPELEKAEEFWNMVVQEFQALQDPSDNKIIGANHLNTKCKLTNHF